MEIRKATINDLEDIQRLNHLLFLKEAKDYDSQLNVSWPLANEGKEYFEKAITAADRIAFVAETEGKVIGYLAGKSWNESTFKDNGLVAELENMLIEEGHRGSGIGSKLVDRFLDWTKTIGAKRIVVTASFQNVDAIKFYKKLGFEDFDTKLKLDIKN